jgi:hypothetical protein
MTVSIIVRAGGVAGAFALVAAALTTVPVFGQELTEAQPEAQPEARMTWDPNDPRVGLAAGWMDAGEAIWNLEQRSTLARPEGFVDPENPGTAGFWNTDLAFSGDYLFQGNYSGFQVYDISDPGAPELRLSVVCPGGQGDVSVIGNLLVMSAEETRGRLDCGLGGVQEAVSAERFRGIRIFDLSDMTNPRQVAAVQACRGSHTHTLVTDPDDAENLYVYIQGTGSVRPAEELPGCSGAEPEDDPNTSLFRIEVVRVPLAHPEEAEIVNMPRIFANPETGEIAGLWGGGDHGPGTQRTSRTNQCHDITVYPAIGLAGGACSGNGILLDITDPVNPTRVGEVFDPNFAYWHSATFNNGGSAVVFTDEWGGGTGARCRPTDPETWGANAIFRLNDGEMELAGYYKLPVPQAGTENCVAHNGSIIPVPGRDIMVQAWYQGGISLMDFTDPANPFEIAYFDRGPISEERLYVGGFWSAYWYNGHIYGAEIARGIDVFRLTPSEHLTEAEIAAAEAAVVDAFNAQLQPMVTWTASADVAQSYLDQMVRSSRILDARAERVQAVLDGVRGGGSSTQELENLAAQLEADAEAIRTGRQGGDAMRSAKIAEVLRALAG